MPFIKWHLDQFKQLEVPWTWHIVFGLAELVRDTGWSVPNGGRLPKRLSKDQSIDGTGAYLNSIHGIHEPLGRVRLYTRCCGQTWHGKTKMVNAPMTYIQEPALLWQIDCDEIWTAEQIKLLHSIMVAEPEWSSVWFRCHYFVGPDLVIRNDNCYGNHLDYEWIRVWRYEPGDFFETHEPPRLVRNGRDIGKVRPLKHDRTMFHDLIFQHFAYATPDQLRFKECYYGYKGAYDSWQRLQACDKLPVMLSEYFPWVKDNAEVVKAQSLGIKPLIQC
jgi:hypothetical protein